MGPRAGLDGREISSPPVFDPGPSHQSLYRLSYPAHVTITAFYTRVLTSFKSRWDNKILLLTLP